MSKRTKEESTTLLALTRLAMWFSFSKQTFTGEEVANIILAAWHSYERSKEAREQPALPGEVQP